MSIQDDIFDIGDKLKEIGDKEIEKSFEDLCLFLFDMEVDVAALRKENQELKITIRKLRELK